MKNGHTKKRNPEAFTQFFMLLLADASPGIRKNRPERRRMLQKLQRHEQCPASWKKNEKRGNNMLLKKIKTVLDPEAARNARAASSKRANAKTCAELRARNTQAIAAYKGTEEGTWSDATLLTADNPKFIHVYNGSHKNHINLADGADSAAVPEAFLSSSHGGYGTPSVLRISDGTVISTNRAIEMIARAGGTYSIKVIHNGTNCVNADELEKNIHLKVLADPKYPANTRMFSKAGMGTCRPKKISVTTPFPYYVALFTCSISMEEAGMRRGTSADRK